MKDSSGGARITETTRTQPQKASTKCHLYAAYDHPHNAQVKDELYNLR